MPVSMKSGLGDRNNENTMDIVVTELGNVSMKSGLGDRNNWQSPSRTCLSRAHAGLNEVRSWRPEQSGPYSAEKAVLSKSQ